MSNNILNIIAQLLRNLTISRISPSPKKIDKLDYLSNFLGISIVSGVHAGYCLSTQKNEEIKVDKKYKIVINGFSQFMVCDKSGRHFNLNNSLWYWKWDSIEDWSKIKKGDTILIKYYGWRVPSLGIFPNIVSSHYKK